MTLDGFKGWRQKIQNKTYLLNPFKIIILDQIYDLLIQDFTKWKF